MSAVAERPATVDAFLGGRVEAVQPDDGSHRSGLEAVLLGASLPEGFAGTVIDLGAGSGVAGMCAAARCPDARVVLVERDAGAIAAARESLARPANRGFAGRVAIVAADIAAPEGERRAAGLGRAFADAVIANPPFYGHDSGTASPEAARADAHILAADGLDPWLRAAASALKPGGACVFVFRADGIAELLQAMAGRFGSAAVLPIHPRAAAPAHRILVHAVKGSRQRTEILPAFTLHPVTGGTYLPEAEAILRDGRWLGDAHPPWASFWA